MKKNQGTVFPGRGKLSKILLIMKLKLFLILIFGLQVSAAVHSQNNGKISLNLTDVTLEQVIWEIQKKTDFVFMYGTKDIERVERLTVKEDRKAVYEILQKCLSNTGLTYEISGNAIVIKRGMMPPVGQTVKGKVTDTDGGPLPGVTIIIKGSSVGVVTDLKGEFKMEVPVGNTVLLFSFIGMKTQEVKVKEDKPLRVVMQPDNIGMDEVVVTGYFNRTKESFTGTATTFKGEELRQVNPVNVLSALSILDPSFKMVENIVDGSNPNVIPQFEVRGSSSMPNVKNEYEGNPNMPTFIMDGFEVTAEKVFDMDPNRIESMTLLKDAAATAIYGSRSSNGVVVITTKMPEKGALRLSYNLDLSFDLPDLRDYDLLNAREKLELEKAAGFYSSPVSHLQEERENQYNYKLGLVNRGYDTYWLNKPLRATVGHKHSLFVEGGENSIRYAFDLSYDQAPGIMKESNRERIGAGMMLQYQMKKVTFKNQMTYDAVNSNNSPYGSFSTYARANPYYAYEDENGAYLYMLEDNKRGAFENIPNPLYNTQLHTINRTSYTTFTNNFSIDWFITEAFRVKGNVAIHQKKDEGVIFKPAKHTDFTNLTGENYFRRGIYETSEGKDFGYDANLVLSYFHNQGDHVINGNVVLNVQDMSNEKYSVCVEGFPDENLDFITFGAQYHENRKVSGKDQISRLIGVVGNVNYSYLEKYLLDMSVRTDASSKFGADTRWAPFGSVGIGWNIHNEKFIKDYVAFVNRFKIRASLGWVGSQSFDPFQAIPKYEYNVTDRYRYGIGASMKGIANRGLKWQKTTQRNVGVDFEFLNRRLMLTANFYNNASKSLLTDITLPPSLGFPTYMENVGEIQNKGFDLKLRGTVFRNKDGYLNLAVGVVRNRNKLKKISNSLRAWNETQDDSVMSAPRVRFIEGQSLNVIWGVPSKGINPANGKEMFIDRNGQRTDVWDSRDQRPIGCKDSDIEGNLSVVGGYKGFQLSMYMTYRLGGEMYNQTLVDRVENADKRYNCDRRVLEDRWRNPGDITFFKDVQNGETTQATSRFLQKYNYLQMSSMSVSYDFDTNWLKHFYVQNLRLSFFMNDVFRWSSVKAERGLDYPFARSFRTALRITF